jgi:single-strand DNA-binding protein
MLSKVTGVARLTKDVEVRHSSSGTAIASISLVNSNKRKNANGDQIEDTCFINAVCFGKLAEIAEKWLSRGSQIYFIGDLRQESWTDKDGNKRSSHTITIESFEMLGSKDQTSTSQHQESAKPEIVHETAPRVPEIEIDQDYIPF